MKRKDCFFGLHFDYHANAETKNIGEHFDENVLREIIEKVRPDFIQCDTKGHPGYSSYHTKVGNLAPGLACDLLSEWRRVTREYGISLFSHYSGIWDKKAMADHPEWASVSSSGDRSDRASVFSEYSDKLLIPQLRELALEVGMDGAWVDGECWALLYDFSRGAKKAWNERTGKELVSFEQLDESDRKEYLVFMRESFYAYVKNYIDNVKAVAPDFEITSNWLNTSWVPDNVAFTDYISGDLEPTNSVDSARFDGRVMQSFGRNWDIMSWGISFPVHYAKSAVQLCQEAASIISLGGGFQIYNMQSPSKTVMDEWAIPIWAEVARFCRERQPYCQYSSPIPDIGVLYSPKANYSNLNTFFSRSSDYNMEVNGMVGALCDLGHSVSFIHAQRMEELSLEKYSAIVVTNSSCLEDGVKENLLKYAEKGGQLILVGKDTARLFELELSLQIYPESDVPIVFIDTGCRAELRTPYLKVETEDAETLATMSECIVEGDLACTNPPPTIVPSDELIPSVLDKKYGRGSVRILPINLGKLYFEENTFELKQFIKTAFNDIDYKVSISTPSLADVILSEKQGKRYIHLINLQGEHRCPRVKTFDYIPPLYDVEVKVRCDSMPKDISSKTGTPVRDIKWSDGLLSFKTDVKIHEIIEI